MILRQTVQTGHSILHWQSDYKKKTDHGLSWHSELYHIPPLWVCCRVTERKRRTLFWQSHHTLLACNDVTHVLFQGLITRWCKVPKAGGHVARLDCWEWQEISEFLRRRQGIERMGVHASWKIDTTATWSDTLRMAKQIDRRPRMQHWKARSTTGRGQARTWRWQWHSSRLW